jgi:hypothetical protein
MAQLFADRLAGGAHDLALVMIARPDQAAAAPGAHGIQNAVDFLLPADEGLLAKAFNG